MAPGTFTADELATLAYEVAIYVAVRADVPECVVEARVSEAERIAIVKEELVRRSITDPRDQRVRSRDVFDSAADRLERLLGARAA
jgi:hypothetical protein